MATKAGVGFSENSKSREAGAEAARAALAEARASGCNPNQFRNRLWRARERLRQLLQHVMRTATP